ncbi:MAG: hypothetical protein MMC23_006673 [Stictis urceolatum]|nr:hypothetical protein [Stictis urceolata]
MYTAELLGARDEGLVSAHPEARVINAGDIVKGPHMIGRTCVLESQHQIDRIRSYFKACSWHEGLSCEQRRGEIKIISGRRQKLSDRAWFWAYGPPDEREYVSGSGSPIKSSSRPAPSGVPYSSSIDPPSQGTMEALSIARLSLDNQEASQNVGHEETPPSNSVLASPPDPASGLIPIPATHETESTESDKDDSFHTARESPPPT